MYACGIIFMAVVTFNLFSVSGIKERICDDNENTHINGNACSTYHFAAVSIGVCRYGG